MRPKTGLGFRSVLADQMRAFLTHKRQLGNAYVYLPVLGRFDGFLITHGINTLERLDVPLLQAFTASLQGLRQSTRNTYLAGLKRFLRFLQRIGMLQTDFAARLPVPPTDTSYRPHIYTIRELAAILQAARSLPDWKGRTCFTALHLIYACGLRRSESVRLQVQHVDLKAGTILIDRTKFRKSRRIPIGERAAHYLQTYAEARQQRFGKDTPGSPFFVSRPGTKLGNKFLADAFARCCRLANLAPPEGIRLHHMRHSFAVHRLYKWYLEGYRPQDKLLLLSVYMGHVDIAYTQTYLHLSSDLLRLAGAGCAKGLDAILEGFDGLASR